MVALQITLPEEMLIFVEAQVAAGGLAGPSDYVRALIAAAQREQQDVELDRRFAAAIRAMQGGGPNSLSPEDWQILQQRALARQRPPEGAERAAGASVRRPFA